jgi:hypothetical protein
MLFYDLSGLIQEPKNIERQRIVKLFPVLLVSFRPGIIIFPDFPDKFFDFIK